MTLRCDNYNALKRARVLIVDDEFLIALNLEYLFVDAGASVCTATTVSDAAQLATREPLSVALLDIRLGREDSASIATILSERGIPFLFFSGQPVPAELRQRFPNAPALRKPIGIQQVLQATAALVQAPIG